MHKIFFALDSINLSYPCKNIFTKIYLFVFVFKKRQQRSSSNVMNVTRDGTIIVQANLRPYRKKIVHLMCFVANVIMVNI